MTVYLGETSSKEFNRFILDVLTQIRNYYKLELYIDTAFEEEGQDVDDDKHQMFLESKMDDLKV